MIDATGLHVYPGLFDAATQLGLTEIGAVDVTNDIDELGDYTPQIQARTAVHPASEHIPVARANGITHTMTIPLGGRGGGDAGFAGQGSIIDLDGWTIEQMDVLPSAAMVMSWPSIRTRPRGFGFFGGGQPRSYREAKEEHDKQVHQLAEWLDAARDYARSVDAGASIPRDLRLEALARVVQRKLPVLARVESERDIRDVVAFAERQNIRLIIGGGSEAYRVADLLAAKHIPVILGPTQSLPTGVDRPYDEEYANPGKLAAAGVQIAFATFNSSDSRTLPYEAATAIPYGLSRDAALRAVTAAPADILGVGDRLGTIETGKIANLIVTDGDPLEIQTHILHLVIDGPRGQHHEQAPPALREVPRPAAARRSRGLRRRSAHGGLPRGWCPRGRLPPGRCPRGRLPRGRCQRGRLPRGRCRRGQLPRGRRLDDRRDAAVRKTSRSVKFVVASGAPAGACGTP